MGKRLPAQRDEVIKTMMNRNYKRADEIWRLYKSGDAGNYDLTRRFVTFLCRKYRDQSVEARNSWKVHLYGFYKDLPDIRVWDVGTLLEYCKALQLVCPILGVELTESTLQFDRYVKL